MVILLADSISEAETMEDRMTRAKATRGNPILVLSFSDYLRKLLAGNYGDQDAAYERSYFFTQEVTALMQWKPGGKDFPLDITATGMDRALICLRLQTAVRKAQGAKPSRVRVPTGDYNSAERLAELESFLKEHSFTINDGTSPRGPLQYDLVTWVKVKVDDLNVAA